MTGFGPMGAVATGVLGVGLFVLVEVGVRWALAAFRVSAEAGPDE